MEQLPDGWTPEEWARARADRPWLDILVAIPASPLLKVVGVGASSDVDGVTVELLAVEIREAGAIVHWRALADRASSLMMLDAAISDDRATAYTVVPSHGSGNGRAWSGETMFAPAPSVATTLMVELRASGHPPGWPNMAGHSPVSPEAGPWRFNVVVPRDIRKR
jgi:hypothetical protein